MKKIFNQVTDVNGHVCKYPIAEEHAVFCFTRDKKYCIYALYTKKDLTESKIIEIDYDTYEKEINNYKSTYKKEPITLFLSSIEAVKGIVAFSKYKATVDNMSIEDLLRITKGEKE